MNEETKHDEAAETECSRPPAGVRIVELLATICRVLVFALVCLVLIASVLMGGINFVLPLLVVAGLVFCLGMGMVMCVRHGRFVWFWMPILAIASWIVWVSYIALYVGAVKEGSVSIALVSVIVVMSFLGIAPAALLLLPSSRRWAAEARSCRKKGHPRLRVVLGLICLLLLLAMLLPSTDFFKNITLYHEIHEARDLHNRMLQNDLLRASGSGWVDPASCQDSKQFVQRLLGDKAESAWMSQAWCIAVNPPDDDDFPVIVTDGVDVDQMLDPNGDLSSVEFRHRERCRNRYTEPVVVLRNGQVKFVLAETRQAQGGGVYSVERRSKTPKELFGGRVPRPAPDTYFLTPTGRLKCAGLMTAESVPEGPTVLDVLPVVSRDGDIYGDGTREPLDLLREVSSGRVCWKARYWEQIGQEKKGELRTVRIDSGGKETVLESEPLEKPIWPKLWGIYLKQFLRLSGRPPASVSRVEFNPKETNGIVWFGDEKVVVGGKLLMDLSLGSFTNLIATADKIVIRDGGHDCCGAKIDEQPVLLAVTNASEIAEFNAQIKFVVDVDDMGCCACCGHPGIDWWKDGRRIALTSAHHGFALRWCDFPCDMTFTPDSAKALAKWFKAHGMGDHWGK